MCVCVGGGGGGVPKHGPYLDTAHATPQPFFLRVRNLSHETNDTEDLPRPLNGGSGLAYLSVGHDRMLNAFSLTLN